MADLNVHLKSESMHRREMRRIVPPITWLRLLGSWLVVGFFMAFGENWLGELLSTATATIVFIVLFMAILAASFGVVREADHLAHQLGEPYGTLILTLSIVAIEVILIVSVLLGPGEFPTIGRDSIFAVMMIVLNLVMGICLIAGSARHGDQEFNAQGAVAYLSMIVLLTGIALVLPNYTSLTGQFSAMQAVGISVLTGLLYGVFLWKQMRGHQRYFVQPSQGSMTIKAAMNNEMQRAINLCLGAFVSTVGLTVPAILLIGLIADKQMIMGITHTETVLFIITAALGMLTFNGQRTSPIQGYMHLAVFAVFGLILFYP